MEEFFGSLIWLSQGKIMPQVPSELRTSRVFFVPQSLAATQLGVGEPVFSWKWEGKGFDGKLVAIVVEDDEAGGQIPSGFTQRTFREKIFLFEDIYMEFFDPLDRAWFVNLRIYEGDDAGTPVLFFDLSTENL
jgi:hypothetical protein